MRNGTRPNISAILMISVLAAFSAVISQAQQTQRMGVVIASVENMFSQAGDEVDIVSQAIIGTNVKILVSEKNAGGEEWLRIETPDTYQGWMKASSVRAYLPNGKPYASQGRVFEVLSLLALIYPVTDVTEKKPLATVPISSILEVGECGERWCAVTLPSGIKGWIQKGDGSLREAGFKRPRLSPDEMVAIAKRFLGLPYLWGGGTPLGFDCSGFVQLIYRLSGIEILRDADVQMTKSGLTEVPGGQERPGDLVFFGKAPDKIGHVGMMISREEFINATTWIKPVVQISRLSEAHWKDLYQGARRPKS